MTRLIIGFCCGTIVYRAIKDGRHLDGILALIIYAVYVAEELGG